MEEELKQELIRSLRWEFVKLSKTGQKNLKNQVERRLAQYTNIKNPEKMMKVILEAEKMNQILIKWKKMEKGLNSE